MVLSTREELAAAFGLGLMAFARAVTLCFGTGVLSAYMSDG